MSKKVAFTACGLSPDPKPETVDALEEVAKAAVQSLDGYTPAPPIDLPPIKLKPRFDAAARQPKSHGIDVDLCTLVKADLERRMQVGQRKYGERLKPFNGRDALLDLYQEILDAAMYCRQMIYERDGQ